MEWLVMALLSAWGGFAPPADFAPGTVAPSAIPREPADIVVVKSCHIPGWFPGYLHFAHHTWIDIKRGSEERWLRIEVAEVENGGVAYEIPAREARAVWRWKDRDVHVLGILDGNKAKGAADDILHRARVRGPDYKSCYVALPGPNSNTFIREITRGAAPLSFLFHHNAIGKDYAPRFILEAAPSRTGWTLTCPFGGCTVALFEGVQAHFLGFTIGRLGLPPRPQLPFLP